MNRIASSRFRVLQFLAESLGVARYSTTSAVTSRLSSSSFFGWLTGEHSKSLPPLDFVLDGVSLPPSLPDYVEPSKVKSRSLENGVTIVSEMSANPAASIGLYVDSGSVYETPSSCGATHLLDRMAFKSTRNRSHLRIVREVEAIGGNIGSSAIREQMGYTFDALKTYVPRMVELLIDCVRNPMFLDWELNEEMMKIKDELADHSKNPHGLLLEAIHTTGYDGALANPLIIPESAVNRLNSAVLDEFVAKNFTASRMVLVAYGVELEELVSVAEPLLSDLPRVPHPGFPKSVYVGGDFRHQADSEVTHVAVAFETPGGWKNEKEAIILTVLQMLMGGGGSFSVGGPGKGMHSRLYVRVLNQHHELQSFSAFSSIFNNSGLFGIYASTGSNFVGNAVDIAIRELLEIATPGRVSMVQLNRARETTKSAVLINLESRMVVSEDIGRQVLTYGERKPLDYFLKMVDEITLEDITNTAQKLLSSPLTMASYGDVKQVPRYDHVSGIIASA